METKQSRVGKFRAWQSTHYGREFKVVLLLVCYSFAGAGVFYWLEHKYQPVHQRGISEAMCLGKYSYWASVDYANSLITTIGYGHVYACTTAGKCFTMFYIFIGIPLLLVVLDCLGRMMARLATTVYYRMMNWWNRTRMKVLATVKGILRCGKVVDVVAPIVTSAGPASANAAKIHKRLETEEIPILPLSAAILFSFVWIFVSGAYFSYMEKWSYWESVYFLWISMTTVGLGDFAPERLNYTVVNYFFLIIGLSFVSMFIAIVRTKIHNLMIRIRKRIADQQSEERTPEEMRESLDEKRKNAGFIQSSEEKLLKVLVTAQEYKMLIEKAESGVMVTKSTQFPEVQLNDSVRPPWKLW